VHTHLDWYATDQWLEGVHGPICLAWQQGQLAGLLAMSQPLDNTCWIRLAAVQNRIDATPMLHSLWETMAHDLRQRGIDQVYVLVTKNWLAHEVTALGFEHEELVITLCRQSEHLPESEPKGDTPRFVIRAADYDDLEDIVQIDHAAFEPPWQFAPDELRQAFRVADNCTLAVRDHVIIGYQLSTLYRASGHLARLAVMPSVQGMGVGTLLVDDLIRRLWARDIWVITVNTQESNYRSQHLYFRFDFARSGHDLPVWSVHL
jgi:ribosomal-protein-alanine N-acetyltransferase